MRYHFGIFAITGDGKSNLMSNILRRVLYHTKDTKIIIFDISCEYPFLLIDVLADPAIPARVITESRWKCCCGREGSMVWAGVLPLNGLRI